MKLEVNQADFAKQVIDKSKTIPVVVDFWAGWCGPCMMLGPVMEKLAEEAKGKWILAKVNVDLNPVLAQNYNVMGIPAVKLFWKGQIVDEFVGAVPESQIRQWLTKIKDLK